MTSGTGNMERLLPRMEYRLVPLVDRGPIAMMNFVMPKPQPVCITIVLDLSDSCPDIIRQLIYVRKLLARLPSDWPLEIYRLSSPSPIGRGGLRLLDFIECADILGELCFDPSVVMTSKNSGSFVRPVLETLANQLDAAESETTQMAFVLTDGKFTDFGSVFVHPRLTIAAILRGGESYSSSRNAESNISVIPCFTMQDARLDDLISKFQSPFNGLVLLEPIGRDDEPTPLSSLYRVDKHGRVTPWESHGKPTFNLTSPDCYFLVDAAPQMIETMRWRVHSIPSGATAMIEGASATAAGRRQLEKSIQRHFATDDDPSGPDIRFRYDRTSTNWGRISTMAEDAMRLADRSEPWVDDDSIAVVFHEPAFVGFADEKGKPQCDAIAVAAVYSKSSEELLEIIAFGLHRHVNPALQIGEGDSVAGLRVTRKMILYFDNQLYRWFSKSEDTEPYELEYYASEKIESPFADDRGTVRFAFSGNLR